MKSARVQRFTIRRTARPLSRALGLVALVLALAAPAADASSLLFGIDSPLDATAPSTIYQVNQSTGAATAVVTLNGQAVNASFTDIAYLGGKFYASDIRTTGVQQFGLVSIDAMTGATTVLSANQGGNGNWQGLAANTSANLLYAVDFLTRDLSTFDVLTNTIATVGNTGAALGDLTYDDVNNVLYGLSNAGGFYSINTATGAASLLGQTGLGGLLHGLAYDSSNQAFFASVAQINDQVTSVHRFTLATLTTPTLLGQARVLQMDGLTFAPMNDVPEPASLALVLVGLAAARLRRRSA